MWKCANMWSMVHILCENIVKIWWKSENKFFCDDVSIICEKRMWFSKNVQIFAYVKKVWKRAMVKMLLKMKMC